MIETSFADARSNLTRLLQRVTSDREIVVIKRRGQEDVAMVPASDLSSLVETAYLLVIRPARAPRAGWAEAFARMAAAGEDRMLDG